jgi:hypothetical protein
VALLRRVTDTLEVKDGTWDGGRRILRRPDIYAFVFDSEAREAAERVLAERRRKEAEQVLAAVDEQAR